MGGGHVGGEVGGLDFPGAGVFVGGEVEGNGEATFVGGVVAAAFGEGAVGVFDLEPDGDDGVDGGLAGGGDLEGEFDGVAAFGGGGCGG